MNFWEKLTPYSVKQALFTHDQFGSQVLFPKSEEELKDVDVALLGVEEYRGRGNQKRLASHAMERIRQKIYSLQKSTAPIQVADLGNLEIGEELSDTYQSLTTVCEELFKRNIFPIIIGGSQDLTLPLSKSLMHSLDASISILGIDNSLNGNKDDVLNKSFLNHILDWEGEEYIDYHHIGYQRYITQLEMMEKVRARQGELLSIGMFRDEKEEVEPLIRSCEFISFDLSAIKKMEGGASPYSNLFGFKAEEACQLCWYAGMSDKLKMMGFFEYDQAFDINDTGIDALAVMTWYLIEGLAHRKIEPSFSSSRHKQFLVPVDSSSDHMLIFYQSMTSGKWWMEVKDEDDLSEAGKCRKSIVPCSHKDYSMAVNGKLPPRWLRAVQRLKASK
ncbi:arginase family protein [Sediminitomix flava]|uniref:Formiminoglutamase n=1 Tax=Sediminitomix flava TaxID=379075 RepID=A0A315ZHC1_SEDFL|nr:arginase family protein [Sediminitomix flava]PWJ44114.1 formiminoglutamase [Sediminitomix flava]